MSNVTEDPAPFPQQPQSPSGCGGCVTGCLIAFAVICVLGICAGGGIYFWASRTIAKYTSEEPAELPTIEFTAEQLSELETRISTFKESVDEGTAPEEKLVLTAEEINALIGKEEELRGKVFVKIKDGQVSGDVSFPTDAIPGGKGRFFNGSATFDVSMEAGVLIVTLADAEVNGEPVPEAVIEGFAKENLAKDLYKDPKNAEMMRRFESVTIEDDKIVLKLRQQEAVETAPQD